MSDNPFLRPKRSQFAKGVLAGVDSAQAAGYGATALAGTVLGVQGLQDVGLEGYARNTEESARNAGRVQRFEDIGSVGDAADYAAHGVGQLVPFLATSLASGGAGGVAGNVLARKGAEVAARKAVESGASRLGASALARQAVAQGTKRGATLGAAANSVGTEQGLIFGDIHEQTGQLAPGTALGYGAVAGLLDLVPELAVINRLTGPAKTNALRAIGRQVVTEGATEGGQTAIERKAVEAVDPTKQAFSPEGISEIANATLIGMLGGGTVGGVTEGAGAIADLGRNRQPSANPVAQPAPQPAPTQPGPLGETIQPAAAPAPSVPPGVDPETGEIIDQAAAPPVERPPTIAEADPSVPAAVAEQVAAPSGALGKAVINAAQSGVFDQPAAIEGELLPRGGDKLGRDQAGQTIDGQVVRPALEDMRAIVADALETYGGKLTPRQQAAIAKDNGVPTKEVIAIKRELLAGLQAQPQNQQRELAQLPSPQQAEVSAVQQSDTSPAFDETPELLDTDILPPSGEPFSIRGAADAAARRSGDGARVVELADGGFVVRKPALGKVETAAAQAATSPTNDLKEPTEAQKEAGNYTKGHTRINGLAVSIENPAGTSRRPEWPPLANAYGYIKRTRGADGDQVDAFFGPAAEDRTAPVFVVNQNDPKTGSFDEHKVILGARTQEEAEAIYRANYAQDWTGLASISQMHLREFKQWLARGERKAEAPFAQPPVTPGPAAIAADAKRFPVGSKVDVSGAVYEVTGHNDDGTLQVKSDGGEFSTSPGEVVQPAKGDVRREQNAQATLPREEFIKASLEADANRLRAAVGRAEQAIEQYMAGVQVPVGVSRVAKLKAKPRPSKRERELLIALESAERAVDLDRRSEAEMYGRVWDNLQAKGSSAATSAADHTAIAVTGQKARSTAEPDEAGDQPSDDWLASFFTPESKAAADEAARVEAQKAQATQVSRNAMATELRQRADEARAKAAELGRRSIGSINEGRRAKSVEQQGSLAAALDKAAAAIESGNDETIRRAVDEAKAIDASKLSDPGAGDWHVGKLFGADNQSGPGSIGGIIRAFYERPDRRTDPDARAQVDALPSDTRDAEIQRLREQNAQLQQALDKDGGTGVRSREAYRRDHPNANGVAFIDLIAFKGYNTKFTETGGDKILSAFGRVMLDVAGGAAYRRGGDEFAILSDQSPEHAQELAEKLQDAMGQVRVELEDKDGAPHLVSGIPFRTGVGATDAAAVKDSASRKQAGDREANPNVERLERAGPEQGAVQGEEDRPAGRESDRVAAQDNRERVTPDIAANMRPGEIVVDDQGREYRAHSARLKYLEAHPIVDGRAKVNADSRVIFHLDPASSGSYPERNPSPIYRTGRAEGDVTPAPAQPGTEAKAADPGTLDGQSDVMARAESGTISVAEYQAGFAALVANKDRITAELKKLTKQQLVRRIGGYARLSDPKDRLVRNAYQDMLTDYNVSGTLSWSLGESVEAVMQRRVDAVTDADLKAYAAEYAAAMAKRAERVEEVTKAIADPKTYDDYATYITAKRSEGMTFREARDTLNIDQRITLDRLMAERSRGKRREAKTERKTEVRAAQQQTTGEIIQTKHTKHGHDLFVVQLADRVSREDYQTLNNSAKRLGGSYSSFRGRGAVPGFQFRTMESAEAFKALVSGDTDAAQEVSKARRDAFEDDRSQSAVERLREMAGKLDTRADESLARDRKANTERRARFAAAAEAGARADKALAETMRSIAAAIDDGKAGMLDQVRTKSQVELLASQLRRAKDSQLRAETQSYADFEKRQGEQPNAETVEHAEWPSYSLFRSDWAQLGRQLMNTEGSKLLGKRILKLADDVTAAFVKFAKKSENYLRLSTFTTRDGERPKFTTEAAAEASIQRSGYRGKAIPLKISRGEYTIVMSPKEARERGLWDGDPDQRITVSDELGAEVVTKIGKANRRRSRLDQITVPWALDTAHDRLSGFARIGIETPAEMRTALREFQALRQAPAEESRVKKLEREMVGRKADGLDFFPTSAAVVDDMLAAAEIEPGMSVLEPSAGMGHIADAVRDAGVDPDVVEIATDRRELLEAKGHNVIGRDFLDLTDSQYDRILMNPPFSKRRDAEHVQHAYGLLKPGGRIVAIMGEGVFFGQDAKAKAFRDWLDSVDGTSETLPDGSFMDPSLPVNTGVRARMVVIDKPTNASFHRATAPGRMNAARIRSIVDRIGAKWQNAPQIRVIESMAQAPDAMRLEDAKQRQGGAQGSPDAFWYDGKVYIVADAHTGYSSVATALLHEVRGHAGLQGAFGSGMTAVLERIATTRAEQVQAKMRQYGLSGADGRLTAAEEVLAEMAETDPKQGLVRRAIAVIRQFLRRIGVLSRDAISDGEIIREYLEPARRFIEGRHQAGAGVGSPVPSFARRELTDGAKASIKAELESAGFEVRYEDGDPLLYRDGDFVGEGDASLSPRQNALYLSLVEGRWVSVKTDDELYAAETRSFTDFLEQMRGGTSADELLTGDWYERPTPFGYLNADESLLAKSTRLKRSEHFADFSEQTVGGAIGALRYKLGQAGAILHLRSIGIRGVYKNEGSRTLVRDFHAPPEPDRQQLYPEEFAAFHRTPAETVQAMRQVASEGPKGLLERLKDKAVDWGEQALGALTLQQLAEVSRRVLPQIRAYMRTVQAMATDRNVMQERSNGVAERWQKWASKNRAAAETLASLMHDTTIAGVDPSKAYAPLEFTATIKTPDGIGFTEERQQVNPKNINAQIRMLEKRILKRRGLPNNDMIEQIKTLQSLKKAEKARKAAYPELVQRWAALPDEAKALYETVRDEYRDQSNALLDAIEARVKESDMGDDAKRQTLAGLRLRFESQRLQGPYFPLARFGKYWIASTNADGQREFRMVETARDQRKALAELSREGHKNVAHGVSIDQAKGSDGVSSEFMGQIQELFSKVQMPDAIRDEVWQLYLRTMPDVSIRKQFIHRKKTAGYSQDALRAFASHSFHGAFQLARVRWGGQLERIREEARMHVKALSKDGDPDAVRAGQAFNELTRRHEWVSNPTDSSIANKFTGLGFFWYLGATPAAALVNMLQTPTVTLPVLGSRFGFGKSSRALTAAMRESMRTYGHIQKALTGEDLEAFKVLEASGAIDKTQAHNLAGISDQDTSNYNPKWHKLMTGVAHFFHKAEVMNREASGIAAFRLARQSGMSFTEAVGYAQDVIWESHFDYSSANRARFMQGNWIKVLTQFKQYALNTTYFILRNAFLSLKGVGPAERSQARRKLVGVMGMTAVFSGVMGLPMTGLLLGVANAVQSAFGDDDEPWDAEAELRAFLVDHLGEAGARFVMTGPTNAVTGLDVAGRTSMDLIHLWFRPAERELEGRAYAHYLLEQATGPLGAIFINFLRGQQLWGEGQYMRSVEAMVPKVVKDGIRSIRYLKEGANNLRGDPIIDDVGVIDAVAQALGMSPADLSWQYDLNNQRKNYEGHILQRRRRLMDAYAMATRLGDDDGRTEIRRRMVEFSRKFPELAITGDSLRRSLQSRKRYSDRAEGGVVIDRRLQQRIAGQLPAS